MNESKIRVLMVGTDRNILIPGSVVSDRVMEYGNIVDELHIILFSDVKHGLKEVRLTENVYVYPTNSKNRFLRPIDAVRIGNEIECSLIVTQDPFECGWTGMKLKRKKGVPLEVQLHTDPFSPYFSGFLNFIRKQIMPSILNRADGVRVVLESVGNEVKKRYGIDKVSVLPIYIDKRRIEGEPKFDLHDKYGFEHVILAVSRLTEEKNLKLAIEAISLVRDSGLVIVGSGPEESRLKSLVKRLGIGDRVKFEGWQEDLSSYYKTADIFIQTSKFEGYGLSLVEAGLSGLPAVSTDVGIAQELKNVILVKANNRDFSSAITGLLEDKEGRKNIGIKLKSEVDSLVVEKEAYISALRRNWDCLLHLAN